MTKGILLPSSTSIICPLNDGEAVTIVDLAKRLGCDVHVSQQPWGATLANEPALTFVSLKPNVVIIEIPGVEKEAELERKYHLYVLDHHKYDALDRSNLKSSLEQFAELVGYMLNRWEIGIALNDRGYIPALQQNGYTKPEIQQIREFDLKAQGYTQDDFKALEWDYTTGWIHKSRLYVVVTSQHHTSYLGDIHFWNDAAREKKLDLLVLKTSSENTVHDISFSGTPAFAKELFRRLGGFCGGDKDVAMYWGKQLKGETPKDNALQLIDTALFS